MIFDGITIQFQSDSNYKDIVMEQPIWQRYTKGIHKGEFDPDTLGEFACKLCGQLNSSNHFQTKIKKNPDAFMPLDVLNKKMIENKGYFYLWYERLYGGDIEKMKVSCLGKEAYTVDSVIMNILKIREIKYNYTGVVDLSIPNEYYLLHTNFQNTEWGHWSWLIREDCQTVVDSYDGLIKSYPKDKIMNIAKIIF